MRGEENQVSLLMKKHEQEMNMKWLLTMKSTKLLLAALKVCALQTILTLMMIE